MLLFRDDVRTVSAAVLRCELLDALRRTQHPEGLVRLLLLAGELETALADLRSASGPPAQAITDEVAQAWLGGSRLDEDRLERRLTTLALPSELTRRRPEGFAYYALAPSSYAAVVSRRDPRSPTVVVGIRSIGTTLSAVVRAALRLRSVVSERITVRPEGHPWDRVCNFGPCEAAFVHAWRDAHFLVLDEGPGISGSSFLAVGERLERAGVSARRIEFITSHDVDARRLQAPGAVQRWSRFTATTAAPSAAPRQGVEMSAGKWRSSVYLYPAQYPATWQAMERRKILAAGSLVKFIGYSPYGDEPLKRGEVLADAGFSPRVWPSAPGYMGQRWWPGTPCSGVARRNELPRLLDYLAFRHRAFPASAASEDALATMLHINVAESLGATIPASLRLPVEKPVYADGRMLPHEWIQTREGTILKVDATDHGDDHLLPGPCDSAWDLAGTAVEWALSEIETEDLIEGYRARSGDAVKGRLPPYLLAYAAFRLAWCDAALGAAEGDERPRLSRAQRRYSAILQRLLHLPAPWRPRGHGVRPSGEGAPRGEHEAGTITCARRPG